MNTWPKSKEETSPRAITRNDLGLKVSPPGSSRPRLAPKFVIVRARLDICCWQNLILRRVVSLVQVRSWPLMFMSMVLLLSCCHLRVMYEYILAQVFQLFSFVLHIHVCVGVLQTETKSSGLLNNVRISETVVLFGQMLKSSLDWAYKLRR